MWVIDVVVVVNVKESSSGRDTMNPWGVYIPNAVLCIVVYKHRNLVEAKLIRKVAVIVRMAVCVHTRHYSCDHIRVFRWSDSSKEYVRTVPGREEYLFLSLETEVQEMALTEVQD
jgi:hypothetical protein